jgi:hypothetical protein
MAAIQVNMRVPEVLLARINAAAGEQRTAWILEACRMRLDRIDCPGSNPGSEGISLGQLKPNIRTLHDIFAGKKPLPPAQVGNLGVVPLSAFPSRVEIPICGKTWWEDGEQYECLMDKGHKEQKHGMRGMVRRLDA